MLYKEGHGFDTVEIQTGNKRQLATIKARRKRRKKTRRKEKLLVYPYLRDNNNNNYDIYTENNNDDDSLQRTFQRIVSFFVRNPLSSPIILALSVLLVGLGFVAETAFGVISIIVGTLAFLYVIVRFLIMGYNLYSGRKSFGVTIIFILLDLQFAAFFAVALVLMGLYMIDSTPGKDRFFSHTQLGHDRNLFVVWIYFVTLSILLTIGTGITSISEKHVIVALVFSASATIFYFTNVIIIAELIDVILRRIRERERIEFLKQKQKLEKELNKKKPDV